MATTSSLNLALSLLFGVGQIVVGGVLVAQGRRRWRRGSVFLVMLVGVWFVCSGAIELFVSWMESLQRVTGAPGSQTFALWRAHADSALVVATGLIVLCGILAVVSGKLTWRRNSSAY
jgi:uncharacterized membrane protein